MFFVCGRTLPISLKVKLILAIPSSFIFSFQKVLPHIDKGRGGRDLKVIQDYQPTAERALLK